ncbi:RES domain-containing protein [Stenotrophomonas maltophilia]|uniref:RES domain-containing protein n=1 Tax=Stenotrophomonas maltophilia TaxID=40324 RepID=UPI000C15918A|nr:RES domain-containing protein [Stenotrophomonas maltophilia]
MPAGIPWLTEEPTWFNAPDGVLYRVHEAKYSATKPNARSQARFALPGKYAMYYAADSIEGALWEALLRYVVLGPKGKCDFPTAKLRNQVVSRVRLISPDDHRLIELSRPGILHLFPNGNDPVHEVVKQLLVTPDHASTHAEAEALHEALSSLTPPVDAMPMLSWSSRQFEKSTVYLAYQPDGSPDVWQQIGPSKPLDVPEGHQLIKEVLAKHKFDWVPLNTLAVDDIDDDAT